jgi:tripartite-type tricarboxylate transporter receptor subunit TctC
MKTPLLTVVAAACLTLAASAFADEAVSFKGKTITMIIPTTAGANTDLSARLFAKFFSKYLPGEPAAIAQNIPAAHGITALNYVAQQAKPDGLTVTMSSSSQADPITYRAPAAKYDPAKLEIVGSVGAGDTAMIVRTDALPRLLDKSKPPVTMGSVAGVPRTSMRMTVWGIEYLGWNAKWVVGYPGSSDLVLALERGEIDMTAFPKVYLLDRLTDTAKFKVIYHDGEGTDEKPSGRADMDKAASFHAAMAGKITDPKVAEAYDYWRSAILFKWMALPPETPAAIRDTYRAAFRKIVADPQFTALAEQSMPGFTVISAAATEKIIHNLAKTSNEALAVMDELMRKQGLNIAKAKARGEGG